MIGTVLQDKYRIEKKIGEGGFARVYRGTHLQLQRPVAIKMLIDVGERANFRARFLREAESMAQLSHPNIAVVHDFAEFKGQPYLVMELIDGPTLMELASKASLTLPQVCAIESGVCHGMAHAHSQGIIHRDLTLRNIMLSRASGDGGVAKILDFGLAKVVHEDVQTTGKPIGTPYYMAPEQLRNDQIDQRIDIFAFGVGLYRLVNGRFPFEAEHPAALAYLIVNEFNIEFANGIPARLKDLILGCLEKDPKDRIGRFDDIIPEMEAVKAELESSDSSMSSSLAGLAAFADRSSKRNPYVNRVMINHPGDFYGRTREVRKIYSRLDASHPQSMSVVGDRRIGKSSLLNYIYHSRNRRRFMQSNENSIFVYLDFQQNVDYDVPGFITFLITKFSYESKSGHDFTTGEKTLDQLKNVVEELNNEGKRIIILMDEFEVITRNKRFDEHFFSFLRALANRYKVAYVTSSYEDLQKLCHNKDISDSPFFNIFSTMPLRPFKREEAVELIESPSDKEGVPLGSYADRIIEMAGLFPICLQIACSSVFEFLVDNPDADPDWGEVTRTYMEEAAQHYQFVWDHFDEPARQNLRRIASGKAINKEYRFVNEQLERRGYLVSQDGRPDLCSRTFRSFVLEQAAGQRSPRSVFGSLFGRRR